MTSIFDLCKENSYYYFGPSWINRLFGTLVAVSVGTAVSMPFDAIRTRLHTMRPLPNGQLPYDNSIDVIYKMIRYESQTKYSSNL